MPGLAERNAFELGLSGNSMLMIAASEQPLEDSEIQLQHIRRLAPTVNRLLRYFAIAQSITLPEGCGQYAKICARALAGPLVFSRMFGHDSIASRRIGNEVLSVRRVHRLVCTCI